MMRAGTMLGVALCLAACDRPAAPAGNDAASAPYVVPKSISRPETAAVTVPKSFTVDPGAGEIELMQCQMGECYWSQQRSATPVERVGDGVLLKVVSREGNSVTGPGLETAPPEKWSPDIKVDWTDRTSYVRCSLTHPMMLSKLDDKYYVDALQLYVTPGFQVAAANEYMLACHGLAPGKWDEQTLKRLGYAETGSEQASYATLDEGMKAMAR